MVTEDYVSFEIAKLLKEKGFDWKCHAMYDKDGHLAPFNFKLLTKAEKREFVADAPTLQIARKWLREVHNLDIIVPPQFDSSKWTYSAVIIKLSIPCIEIRLNDNKDKKEEACESAIKYCLENLI